MGLKIVAVVLVVVRFMELEGRSIGEEFCRLGLRWLGSKGLN